MKIGFVGLGIMGKAMAGNLTKQSGQPVYVYDHHQTNIDCLVHQGAHACASSREVVKNADVIFTSVPTAASVAEVHAEAYPVIKQGQIFADLSTISPKDSVELGKKLAEHGAIFLDVPVVKSKQQAIDGTLGIYVGGPKASYERIKPLLEILGSDIIYVGEAGKGITMKILHNMLVGEIQNGVNELMSLAEKNDINWQTFLQAISIGGANNFYLQTKAENIGKRNFATAFSVKNMRKDVKIAQQLAQDAKLNLPGINLVNDIYRDAVNHQLSDLDFSASFKEVERRANGKN